MGPPWISAKNFLAVSTLRIWFDDRYAGLVVLPDIAIRPFEQLRVLVELVLEPRLPQGDFHLALTRVGVLPAIETNGAYNLVDVIDDALDHDRRVDAFRLLEEFRKRGLATINLFLDRNLALESHDILREFEQFLQKIDAD